MSDLADLAEALVKDLPISARRIINKAVETGWELNQPGMTVVLRLNHPQGDEFAQPIYVCWAVKKTPTGKLGFTFVSASTAAMIPMKPADVLEYLEDPTVVLETPEELETRHQEWLDKQRPKWSDGVPPEVNVANQLGNPIAPIVGIERKYKNDSRGGLSAAEVMARAKAKQQMEAQRSTPPARPAVRPLQVKLPGR